MNRQERAIARAHKAVERLAFLDVVYVDGATELPVKAVKTESDVETIAADGSTVMARSTDWRIHAEDLVRAGEYIGFDPRRGAQIVWTADGVTRTYEVQPVAGDACYEEADPYGQVFKIHSKLISEAPA